MKGASHEHMAVTVFEHFEHMVEHMAVTMFEHIVTALCLNTYGCNNV